jgi:hypothetical protein
LKVASWEKLKRTPGSDANPSVCFESAALPAGFMGHVPVQILRDFDAGWLGLLVAFAVLIWVAALVVFKLGLRRYESGNLIVLRG